MNFFRWLVEASPLTPHGFCLLWQPGLLWVDAASDGATMLAYFSIPITLAWFARRRPDLPHRWIALLFVCFIVACGLTHGFSILTLWVPVYAQEAAAKLITAVLSISTAIVLWPLVPKLLALPSPAQIVRLNQQLLQTVEEEQQTAARLRESERRLLLAQHTLRQANEMLEHRVAERTAELEDNAQRLRQSEFFLNRTSVIAGVGGWEFDLASGNGSCSEECYRILGLSPDIRPHMRLALRLVAPDSRAAVRTAMARALRGKGGWDLELTCVRGDGTRIWVRSVGSVETRDGRNTTLTGAIQDITFRVNKRIALATAKARLSLATESCGIGIWDWDVVRNEMVWEPTMYALYDIDQNAGPAGVDLWRNRLHPDDLSAAEEMLRDSLAGTRPFDTEFRIIRRDGSIRHIHGTGRVTRDDSGRPVRMVGTNWDVTERHAAQEMREARDEADRASRAKSEFLATMSHEIRSPLSGLLGLLELVRTTDLDTEQGRMIDMAHDSGSNLLAVLNDILDFSKIEANAVSIVPEATPLHGFINDVVQPHALSAMHRGLQLDLSLEPGLPEAIMTDSLRLRQILNNLLSNAVKFTPAGMITVSVGPEQGTAPPMIRLAVRDTGIGMNEEVLGRLFRPFTQADGSTSRTYGGTGLGLSISQKLAQLMQGVIKVTSTAGRGSEFVLYLPMVTCAPETPAVPIILPETLSTPLSTTQRVLVVDDDATIRWLTHRQLEKMGYLVELATDGAEGFRRLQEGRYDLVLTDCHMPNMDGVALTKAIRSAADPTLSVMPVIGLTADVTEVQRERCVEAGMSDLAIKPQTIDSLSILLRRHLPPPADAAGSGAGEAPALQRVAFDEQIYLAVFTPGEPEGAAWLQDYLETARVDRAKLDDVATQANGPGGSTAAVASVAHRLAGSSFSVGAMLLGDAARAVETAAKLGDVDALQTRLPKVDVAFVQAETAITQFLHQNAAMITLDANE